MNNKYISWRRVSTFKQNRSGLGLEAQKEIIRYFVERDNGELVADYSECYTGKELSGCKELRKAMKHAKDIGAVLVIAKSDRFRNCQEALGILDEMGEGHIEFCDLPHSDRFTLTLFWALAEREALITSIRTKQALAVKKAQGCKLGGASKKWQEARIRKDSTTLKEEQTRRGKTKNERYLAKQDTQVFIRVLRNVFPDICQGPPETWHGWWRINTKKENRAKILHLMKDYKDMDATGTLFPCWDFHAPDYETSRTLQVKLATAIKTLREAVERYKGRDE